MKKQNYNDRWIKQKHKLFVEKNWQIVSYDRYRVLMNRWYTENDIVEKKHIKEKGKSRVRVKYEELSKKYDEFYQFSHFISLYRTNTIRWIEEKYKKHREKLRKRNLWKWYIERYVFWFCFQSYINRFNSGMTDEEIDTEFRTRNIRKREYFFEEDFAYLLNNCK